MRVLRDSKRDSVGSIREIHSKARSAARMMLDGRDWSPKKKPLKKQTEKAVQTNRPAGRPKRAGLNLAVDATEDLIAYDDSEISVASRNIARVIRNYWHAQWPDRDLTPLASDSRLRWYDPKDLNGENLASSIRRALHHRRKI